MKMNSTIKSIFFLMIAFGFFMAGCQKEKPEKASTDSSSLQQLSKDESAIQSAADEVMADVSNVLSGIKLKSTHGIPCNSTLDSTSVINDTITYHITYHGLNCLETKNRTGKVSVKRKVNTHWISAGAFVMVIFENYHETNVMNGKSITLNGLFNYQNVSGGLIFLLGNGFTSVTYKSSGSLRVTFDDQSSRNWNLARIQIFAGIPGQIIQSVNGFGTADGYSNLISWGTNRKDEHFYSQIKESVIYKEKCLWFPVAGQTKFLIPAHHKSATVTYGFNDYNKPVTGNNCATRYKLDWEQNAMSGTIFLPFF